MEYIEPDHMIVVRFTAPARGRVVEITVDSDGPLNVVVLPHEELVSFLTDEGYEYYLDMNDMFGYRTVRFTPAPRERWALVLANDGPETVNVSYDVRW